MKKQNRNSLMTFHSNSFLFSYTILLWKKQKSENYILRTLNTVVTRRLNIHHSGRDWTNDGMKKKQSTHQNSLKDLWKIMNQYWTQKTFRRLWKKQQHSRIQLLWQSYERSIFQKKKWQRTKTFIAEDKVDEIMMDSNEWIERMNKKILEQKPETIFFADPRNSGDKPMPYYSKEYSEKLQSLIKKQYFLSFADKFVTAFIGAVAGFLITAAVYSHIIAK